MPELTPEPAPRGENKVKQLENRIQVLEKTIEKLLVFVDEVESNLGENLMPSGEYYGHKFE